MTNKRLWTGSADLTTSNGVVSHHHFVSLDGDHFYEVDREISWDDYSDLEELFKPTITLMSGGGKKMCGKLSMSRRWILSFTENGKIEELLQPNIKE